MGLLRGINKKVISTIVLSVLMASNVCATEVVSVQVENLPEQEIALEEVGELPKQEITLEEAEELLEQEVTTVESKEFIDQLNVETDNNLNSQEIFMGVQLKNTIETTSSTNKYYFTVEDAANMNLKLVLQANQSITLKIHNEDGEEILNTVLINNSTNSSTKNSYYILEPGVYSMDISSYAGTTGQYSLLMKYNTYYKVDEIVGKHDSIENAHELPGKGSYTFRGLLPLGNEKDVYKIVIDAPIACLQVSWKLGSGNWTSGSGYSHDIIDAEGNSVVVSGVTTSYCLVPAGTYYAVLNKPKSENGSNYAMEWTIIDDYNLTEKEDNNNPEAANLIQLNGKAYYGALPYSKSDDFGKDIDYYKFNVDEKDTVNLSIKGRTYANRYSYCYYEIRKSTGEVVGGRYFNGDSEIKTSVVLEPGDYYLVVNTKKDHVGTYEFNLTSKKVQDFEDQQQKLIQFVERLYDKCFGRPADKSGLDYWVGALQKNEATGADVGKFFVNSKEILDQQLSNDAYMDILYPAFFNRVADDAGKAYWIGKLNNGMTQYGVLASFINSDEYKEICQGYGITTGVMEVGNASQIYPSKTEFVYKFYEKCMGRKAGLSELDFWVAELVLGHYTGSSFADFFVFSEEFQSKKLSNDAYIEEMYKVFFNRESDIPGKAYWLGQLNNGTSKKSIFEGFVNSDEFIYSCKVAEIQHK